MREGFVLAGGRSSRLGTTKALLSFRGQTLLHRSVEVLRGLGLEVRILVGSLEDLPQDPPAPLLVDRFTGCGPLGGIHSGLSASQGKRSVFLACDSPLVPQRLLEVLMENSRSFDIVIPRDGVMRLHPLIAVYSRGCLEEIEERLGRRRLRVDELLLSRGLRCRILDARRYGVADQCFLNVNTPDDLLELQRLAAKEDAEERR